MPVTFQDIFKTSFLEKAAARPLCWTWPSPWCFPSCWGLFVFFIYKQCYAGVMYSPSFGVTLVALCLITTLLILTVVEQHRPVVGHGGGLVHRPVPHRHQRAHGHRFPVLGHRRGDCPGGGAGIFWAVGGSLFIGGGALRFLQAQGRRRPPTSSWSTCGSGEAENRAKELIASQVKRMQLKSKSVEQGLVELHWEVRLKRGGRRLLRRAGAHGGRRPGSAGLLQRGLHGVSHGHIKAWG